MYYSVFKGSAFIFITNNFSIDIQHIRVLDTYGLYLTTI